MQMRHLLRLACTIWARLATFFPGGLPKVLRGPGAAAHLEQTTFRGLDENKDEKLTVGELSPFVDAVLNGV